MAALLSKTAEKILRIMLNGPLKEFKEIELIREAGTGKGAASVLIDSLIQEKVLSVRRAGRTKMLSLKRDSPTLFALKFLFDQQKISSLSPRRKAAIFLFKQELQSAAPLIIVFGSVIAGTATKDSDIDLMVVCFDQTRVELARKRTEELIGERLNLHFYTEKEIEQLADKDAFVQKVLLSGALVAGYELTRTLYLSIEKTKKELKSRVLYFKERIIAARRNYLQKDLESAQEILKQLQEQLIFSLLTKKEIPYQSKKDAAKAIRKLPEGKVLTALAKSHLKQKIDKLDLLVQEQLIEAVLEEEGYG